MGAAPGRRREGRNVSELCREFGVRRETVYVWLRRYRDAGHKLETLEARSHHPHQMPTQLPIEVRDVIDQKGMRASALRRRFLFGRSVTSRVSEGMRDRDLARPSGGWRRTLRSSQGWSA